MASKILALILLVYLSINFQQDCVKPLDDSYINSVDLIATVQITDGGTDWRGKFFSGNIMNVYRGYTSDGILIKDGPESYVFELESKYLIYAVKDGDYGYRVAKCSRTTELEKASKDIAYLDSHIDCIKKPAEWGACHRIYTPVCGCDNKTYGNSCEAGRAGVLKYTLGRCKKE